MDIKRHPDTTIFTKCGCGKFGLKSYDNPGQSSASKETVAQEISAQEKPSKGAPSPKDNALSFTDAALKVLEIFGKHQPLHYRVITERAVQKGWLVSKGKTLRQLFTHRSLQKSKDVREEVILRDLSSAEKAL